MKKGLKIVLIILILLILICLGNFLLTTLKEKSEMKEAESGILGWTDYYKKIAEERCRRGTYYSECCMSGLRTMVKNSYLLADEDENCPGGFKANVLLCIDSLVWCEPIK